ncbi:hypothetical protein [Leuconostoc falkenbergense]|uniref:hypothetical protein n=1 Tax=Leuconostoc falkenbergense TaxID=2766470 RepID=UPI0024A86B5A|nr:hypothetical protein [Leuconostoc falkenbergense]MDI6552916.1 hypothetical protein [Leuconostoc falkenbergense]
MSETNNKPFITELYDKLNSVLGGTNPDQFLCMTLPGTVLAEESFKYDIRKDKPLRVAANESRLANKLFDPVQVTGSDNGKMLTTQYKSALDMLSPRMNMEVMHAKLNLRKMLASPYTYNFGNGDETSTLQQVFYRLYDEWIAEKKHWAEVQTAKRKELRAIYPKTAKDDLSQKAIDDENNYQEEFLAWFQDNAETYLVAIEEKLGKILGIFSINDMRIIQGMLDTGSGVEINEARLRLSNAEKLNPDGGTVYPVSFYPEDWHTKLSTSFQYTDLLDSKEALSQKLGVLSRQRRNLMSRFENLMALVPSDATLERLQKEFNNTKATFNKYFEVAGQTYTDSAMGLINQLVVVANAVAGTTKKDETITSTGNASKENLGDSETKAEIITKVIDVFGSQQKEVLAAQQSLNETTEAYLNSAMALGEAKLGRQIMPLVGDLNSQIDAVNDDIESIGQKLALAVQFEQGTADDVTPNMLANGYMELLMSSTMSQAVSSSQQINKASNSKTNAGFWFFGGSHDSSHSENSMNSLAHDSNAAIDIGMAVTKVSIGRNWFNPGVFSLTQDMFKTSAKKISSDPGQPINGSYPNLRDNLFPVYPTAFVIAKDVTIRLTTSESVSDVAASAVEDHVSSGGGFFGFHTSSGYASSSSKQTSPVQTNGNTITVRFAEPQIIGYYLQVVPEDRSEVITMDNMTLLENSASILDFVNKMKDALAANAVKSV